MKQLITLSIILLLAGSLFGQSQLTTTPNASPKATTGQTIGITKVQVTYFRPAVKEREIWGKMVPHNTIWRAGANNNTVIKFSTDVQIEGQDLPAGVYGLHLIPSEEEATLILSNNHTAWGSFSYNEAEDALRVTIKPENIDHHVEHLTFAFGDLKNDAATCALQWGKRQFPFEIKVDLEETVVANLRNELQNKPGFSWQGWFEAANYCFRNDINHQEALGWASRSAFMNPTPQNLVLKAKLAGKVKAPDNKEEALKVSLKSLEGDLAAMPVTWKEWNAAANFALQNEKNEKALSWADQSIKMNPRMTNMMVKAQLLTAMGKKEDAAMIKKKAISNGTNAELNNYGYQLLFGGKTSEALEIFEANVEKNPGDPNVWDSLGEGYFNAGEKEKAIKALKKSLSLNPPANVKANSMRLLGQMGVNLEEETTKMKPE